MFKQSRLMITAHQHREIRIAQAVYQTAMQNVVGQPFDFVMLAGTTDDANLVAEAVIAPQRFGIDVRVVGDEAVGGFQDDAAATIVLFELDDFERGEIAGQLQHVLGPRTAPGVDRLVVVTDHGQAAVAAGQ